MSGELRTDHWQSFPPEFAALLERAHQPEYVDFSCRNPSDLEIFVCLRPGLFLQPRPRISP